MSMNRDNDIKILNALCAAAEMRTELTHGALRAKDSTQVATFVRDAVIHAAFYNYRVPMARIAAYFGKTRSGVYAALKRSNRTVRFNDVLAEIRSFMERDDTSSRLREIEDDAKREYDAKREQLAEGRLIPRNRPNIHDE